jgi:hypothetical protein
VIVPHLIKNVPYDALKDFDLLMVAVPGAQRARRPGELALQERRGGPCATAQRARQDELRVVRRRLVGPSDRRALLAAERHQGPARPVQRRRAGDRRSPGGQVDASFQNINAIVTQVNAGKLRALAVTGDKRSPLLPAGANARRGRRAQRGRLLVAGVAAPKGLPADVRATLHAAMVKAMNDPQVTGKLTEVGFEIVANTPAQFEAFQRSEYARWKKVIEDGKITAE